MPKYGDTPSDHTLDLCRTCEHAFIVEGRTQSEGFKRCAWISAPYPQYPILKCSQYEERGDVKRQDMEKIAWIIEVRRKNGEFIGFRADKPKVEKEKSRTPWED